MNPVPGSCNGQSRGQGVKLSPSARKALPVAEGTELCDANWSQGGGKVRTLQEGLPPPEGCWALRPQAPLPRPSNPMDRTGKNHMCGEGVLPPSFLPPLFTEHLLHTHHSSRRCFGDTPPPVRETDKEDNNTRGTRAEAEIE